MTGIIEFLREFNIYTSLIRIFLALILGGVIGVERERHGHAAGFRTHILVALGSTMTILVGLFSINVLGIQSDPLRIGAQVISGIGFLGVGTILITGKKHVKGLTTAAGLWSTAAIGLAAGIGFYEGALVCTVIICFVMARFKSIDLLFFKRSGMISVYMEINETSIINNVFEDLKTAGIELYNVEVLPAKSSAQGSLGIEATINKDKKIESQEIINKISSIEGISFILEII